MKGGLGIASIERGDLLVCAVVAVNSLGNIYDRETGAYLAGAYREIDGSRAFIEPLETMPLILSGLSGERANTTIGVVLTNAVLTKPNANRVANMAHDGFARAIYPSHTSFDGDAIFVLATGAVEAQHDVVGALAALATEHAVLDAVLSAKEAYGLPAARSFAEIPTHCPMPS
jgi:L-aminopeptidase/D-esterase-like protein